MPILLLKILNMYFLSSYLDSWWYHELEVYLGSSSKAMADREKKGEDGNTKIWISWEQKELLDEIKTSFIVFEGLSFCEK